MINHFDFTLAKWLAPEAFKQLDISGDWGGVWIREKYKKKTLKGWQAVCVYSKGKYANINILLFDSDTEEAWLMYSLCLSKWENVSQNVTYMCWEAFGKWSAYCGAESSGPWGAAWLMTIMTGRWGNIRLEIRKKLMLSLVMRSVK